MIQLTHVATSSPVAAPALLLIPGGPGLSSLTLRSLEILKRSFDLYFVDFPGTNGAPYDRDRTFKELGSELASEVEKLQKPVIALGHSFGAFFAADLALRSSRVTGLVCIAAPFSQRILDALGSRYQSRKPSALEQATERWNANPSDQTFAEWVSEYGPLYFADSSLSGGRELLLTDPCSHRFFLANRKDAALMEPLLRKLKSWPSKKLFVAGKEDGLLDWELAREDAVSAGFHFVAIEGGNHFVTFDRPETVAQLIEETFNV